MSFPTDFSCSIGSNSTFLREHNNSSSLLLACKGIKHRMVFAITRFKFLFVAILTSFISPFLNTNFMLCFMTVSNWLFQFETNQRLTKVNITTSQTQGNLRNRDHRKHSRRCKSRRKDILWWYHVNKYRATRETRRELAPAQKSPQCPSVPYATETTENTCHGYHGQSNHSASVSHFRKFLGRYLHN